MFMDDALRILTNLTGQEYEAFRVVRDALYMAETQINDIRNLNDALDAAEQRAAEAEALLAECKEILRAVIDGECTHKAAAKWLEEHSPHEHG